MECCYQIEVCNPCEGVPEHFKNENGGVYLDLQVGSDVEILKSKGELTDINQIKIDAVLAITIPKSDLNKTVLGHFFCFGTIDRDEKPLEIRFTISGEVMPFRLLTVTGKSDSACTYDIQVNYEDDHWATLAGDCPICDVDFGEYAEFELNTENIIDTWDIYDLNSPMSWQDGSPLYMFPPVNYGQGISQAKDFRPWFSLTGMMKALFKKIGWKLDAPILETEYFRSKWMYLSPESYGTPVELNLDQYAFYSEIKNYIHNPQNLSETIVPFIELHDPNGDYSSITHYNGNNNIIQELCIDYKFTVLSNNNTIEIIRRRQTPNPSAPNSFFYSTLATIDLSLYDIGETISGRICTECDLFETDIAISSGTDNVYYQVFIRDELEIERMSFYNRPKEYKYTNGDIITMKDTLDAECNALDVIKGVLHLFNGKIETDFCSKCITIRPPFDLDCGGEFVEGFYKVNEPVDITEMIICESHQSSLTNLNDKESVCVFGFKESSDSAVESQSSDEYQILDAVIQTNGLSGETKDKRNPVFEPTALAEMPSLAIENGIPHLPQLLDNDDGEESFDLGKRIMCFYRGLQQYGSNQDFAIIDIGDIFLNNYPTGFHKLEGENFTLFNYEQLKSLSYESYYCEFYEVEERNNNSANQSFDIFLCPGECKGWSFRDMLCGTYEGKPFNIFADELTANVCNYKGTLQFTEEYKTFLKPPNAGTGGIVRVTK